MAAPIVCCWSRSSAIHLAAELYRYSKSKDTGPRYPSKYGEKTGADTWRGNGVEVRAAEEGPAGQALSWGSGNELSKLLGRKEGREATEQKGEVRLAIEPRGREKWRALGRWVDGGSEKKYRQVRFHKAKPLPLCREVSFSFSLS